MSKLNVPTQRLDYGLLLKLPNEKNLIVDKIYRDFSVVIEGQTFPVNFLPLKLRDFEIIVGMDWLVKNKANLDCSKNEFV